MSCLCSSDPLEKKSDVPPQWPSEGAIDFDHVILKYREDLPPVLKGTTFNIRAGEKVSLSSCLEDSPGLYSTDVLVSVQVGIVGRTGAGKSSLLQALFRTVEISGGKISIDGQDLRQLDLHILRSQLGIVPQVRLPLPPFRCFQSDADNVFLAGPIPVERLRPNQPRPQRRQDRC